ncbi:copper chaperone PCu(A)C [Corynebacterium phocae]|nr:copper chaperone PCu(A)C [Corynebacterium phocae]
MKDKDHDHDDMDKEDGEAHSGLHMHDAVVRAMDETSDMTAIFGEIHNSTDKEVTIVGFKSSVDAKMNQIHEVTDGVMKEKEGGITLAAGEDIDLEPGGYHFMLMGVAKPIMAGETVDLTLELKDGSTIDVKGIPVRTMGAGAEGYEDMHGHDHDDHDGHDHDDHDHDDHDHDDHDHDHDDKN